MGLLYIFLLVSSSSLVLSLGLYSRCFRLSWPISLLWGFLGPFYGFYRLCHQPHLLSFFFWVHSVHFCLLSISPNAHGFTTSFFRFLWASLLSLRPFCYFTGLWTIIHAIRGQWFFSQLANSSSLFPPILLGFFLILGLLAKMGINNHQLQSFSYQFLKFSFLY